MKSFGQPRHYFDSIPSTMDRITALALAGAPEGTVVVAGEQTAGRGRAGRSWNAPAGSSLLMSVLLRPAVSTADLPPLPLIAGLGIAEGIESLTGSPASIRLKWPNDLYLHDLKLAGVLIQSRSSTSGVEFINLGVGINVKTSAENLPAGATSLAVATGRNWQIDVLERAVLDALALRYDEFLRHGSERGLAAWFRRSLYRNELVQIEQHGEAIEGCFTGVAANGALMLETVSGTLQIVAGDLVRGPRRR